MLYLKYNKDEIIGDMGWYEAIVTKGGVDLSQVNCRSMQSKIVKGLYFAGEVLDFDGDTGGFNLQTAFFSDFPVPFFSGFFSSGAS